MTWWPFDPTVPMAVPVFFGVAKGLLFVFLGGLALLVVALWWAWAGDGLHIPRERWPWPVRALALVGWGAFVGGLVGQVVAYFVHVGVARW